MVVAHYGLIGSILRTDWSIRISLFCAFVYLFVCFQPFICRRSAQKWKCLHTPCVELRRHSGLHFSGLANLESVWLTLWYILCSTLYIFAVDLVIYNFLHPFLGLYLCLFIFASIAMAAQATFSDRDSGGSYQQRGNGVVDLVAGILGCGQ